MHICLFICVHKKMTNYKLQRLHFSGVLVTYISCTDNYHTCGCVSFCAFVFLCRCRHACAFVCVCTHACHDNADLLDMPNNLPGAIEAACTSGDPMSRVRESQHVCTIKEERNWGRGRKGRGEIRSRM